MSVPVIAYIDGGARGNPGPAGYGVSIETTDGNVIDQLAGTIGIATNNSAEYQALIAALEYLVAHGHREVIIRSDSQLLTRQMRGDYRVKHHVLRLLHTRATGLATKLSSVKYEHVLREHNQRADTLANVAMDEGPASRTADTVKVPAFSQTGAKDSALTMVPETSIVSIGIDIEEVARIDKLARRYGNRFIRRIFTDQEADYCQRRRFPAQHLAARFSAKEATMKALGTGRSRGILWRDIEVIRKDGPPKLMLHGGAQRRLRTLSAVAALLSITHTRTLSMAQVILVRQ